MALSTIHIVLDNVAKNDQEIAKDQVDISNGVETDSGNKDKAVKTKAGFNTVKKAVTIAAVGAIAINTINKSIGYELSNYGAMYGDQARQNEINNMMSVGKTALSYGAGIVGATIAGGPILGAIAAVGIGIGQAFSMVTNANDYKMLDAERNLTTDMNRNK